MTVFVFLVFDIKANLGKCHKKSLSRKGKGADDVLAVVMMFSFFNLTGSN